MGTERKFSTSAACEICAPACSTDTPPKSLRNRQSVKKWVKEKKKKTKETGC